MSDNNIHFLPVTSTCSKSNLSSHSTTEPTEIDYLLALLESQRSHDRLTLSQDNNIKKLLATYEEEAKKLKESESNESSDVISPSPYPEEIIFSDLVTKHNKRGHSQKRILLLTTLAIYNIDPTNTKKAKRRIQLDTLASVSVTVDTDDFILHITQSYDYHYTTHRRNDFLHLLSSYYKRLVHTELSVCVRRSSGIDKWVLTKQKRIELQSYMQNTSSSRITRTLRSLVSKKKIRYKVDGFDLDLTYITPRIIAMGFPSDDYEYIYRNPYSEVFRLLESKHQGYYHVYNLCSERYYDAYSTHFHNHKYLTRFPFDDHNPPPFSLIYLFCTHAVNHLSTNNKNIIAVHCKAGKGRTGVMLSCLLLHAAYLPTAHDALTMFGVKRTANGKGVTIPSQRRYVEYYEYWLKNWYSAANRFNINHFNLHTSSVEDDNNHLFDWRGQSVAITSLLIHHHPINLTTTSITTYATMPSSTDYANLPYFIVTIPSPSTPHNSDSSVKRYETVYDSREWPAAYPTITGSILQLPCHFVVSGDVKISLYYPSHNNPTSLPVGNTNNRNSKIFHPTPDKQLEICHFWFHTLFLPFNKNESRNSSTPPEGQNSTPQSTSIDNIGHLLLSKSELDKACKDKSNKKLHSQFGIELTYSITTPIHSQPVTIPSTYRHSTLYPHTIASPSVDIPSFELTTSISSSNSMISSSIQLNTNNKATDIVNRLRCVEREYCLQEREMIRILGIVGELRDEISQMKKDRKEKKNITKSHMEEQKEIDNHHYCSNMNNKDTPVIDRYFMDPIHDSTGDFYENGRASRIMKGRLIDEVEDEDSGSSEEDDEINYTG